MLEKTSIHGSIVSGRAALRAGSSRTRTPTTTNLPAMVRRARSDASLLLLPPIPGAAPADAPVATSAAAPASAFDERGAAVIAYENRRYNKSIAKQLADERKLAAKLEHEYLRAMPMKRALRRSSASFTSLKAIDYEALKLEHAKKGERAYYTRKTSQKTREIATVSAGASRTNDGYVPWRPTQHRPDLGSAADLLTVPPPTLDPSKTASAAASATLSVDVHRLAKLMGPNGYTPEQAHLHLIQESLRKQWRADAAEEISDDEEEESTSQLLCLLGGSGANSRKVVEVFIELDRDRDGQVTRDDLRQRLTALGAKDDEDTRAEIDRFFERLDADMSGYIGYTELREMLHKNRKIRLTRRLRDRAAGIVTAPPAPPSSARASHLYIVPSTLITRSCNNTFYTSGIAPRRLRVSPLTSLFPSQQ